MGSFKSEKTIDWDTEDDRVVHSTYLDFCKTLHFLCLISEKNTHLINIKTKDLFYVISASQSKVLACFLSFLLITFRIIFNIVIFFCVIYLIIIIIFFLFYYIHWVLITFFLTLTLNVLNWMKETNKYEFLFSLIKN